MKRHIPLLLPIVLGFNIVACSNTAIKEDTTNIDPLLANLPSKDANETASNETADQAPKEYPIRSFDEETLYNVLVGELAGSRNQLDLSLENYLEAARRTSDPGVARRATQIALFANQPNKVLDAALVWAQSDPNNSDAQQVAALQLIQARQFDQAMTFLERILDMDGEPDFAYLAVNAESLPTPARLDLMMRFQELQNKYSSNNSLKFGQAILFEQNGDYLKALPLIDSLPPSLASELDVILLKGRVLYNVGERERAFAFLKDQVFAKPDSVRLKFLYARLLADSGQTIQADQQFTELLNLTESNARALVSLGLLCIDNSLNKYAKSFFNQVLALDQQSSSAYYYLGQIAEKEANTDQALDYYEKINSGQEKYAALSRRVSILAEKNRLTQALDVLSQAKNGEPENNINVILIESELLAREGKNDQAFSALAQGLSEYQDNSELLYARGMLSANTNQLKQMENDFRKVLAKDPSNPDVLNALGYTLADKTERYQEALELISKALAIRPNEAAFIDSMGWVQYRLGNLEEAEKQLRRAYALFPDPEVAAHLGEVLWVRGKTQEAEKIWQEALTDDDSSNIIREAQKRLKN